MEDDQKNSKWKTTKKFKLEDDQKIQNGRRPKNSNWKTTKKNQIGRQLKKITMEDNQKNSRQPKKSRWKMTQKIKMEDNQIN